MKTMTAIQIIQKESRFLGMSFVEVMQDIEKHGLSVYSAKVVEAFKIVVCEV